MAVVGDAYIVVRALTDKVEGDIRRGFSGVDGAGRRAGESMGEAFTKGFNQNADQNVFGRFIDGLNKMAPGAEQVRKQFQQLAARSYMVGTALAQILGAISALIGGLVALGGAAGGAIATFAVLGNVFAAFALAMISAKLALGGVGKALGAVNNQGGGAGDAARAAALQRVTDAERALAQTIENNRETLVDANNAVRDAQLALNDAIKQGQEEIQQLGFDAEEAAISEQRAAIELEKAREVLARVQDLPPNSRARQEAELAFAEAELNLRRAKDRSEDLNAEQDRLARTGVAGTEVVIDATNRLAEAEADKARAVRDAARAQVAAEEQVAAAKVAAASAGGGGVDPFKGLTQSQKDFVNFLVGLKPLMAELRQVTSDAFLPPLTQAITLLATRAFPVIRDGLEIVAGAVGNATVSIAEALTEAKTLINIETLFSSSARIIEGLGRSIGNVFRGVLGLLAYLAPLAERFVGFLEKKSGAFANFFNADENKKKITDFFERAEWSTSKFGEVFGNIFGGIGAIINANIGPGTGGGYLLEWLVEATEGFSKLSEDTGLNDYFLNVATNAQKVMSSIGALISELIALGENQSIGATFDILATGAPIVGDILNKFADAGESAALLVVEIVKIVDAFTDTASMEVFFTTLLVLAQNVNDLLDNELVKSFMAVSSQFFAFGAALVIAQGIAKKVFLFMVGSATGVYNAIMWLPRAATFVQGGFIKMSAASIPLHTKFVTMAGSSNIFTAALGRMGLAAQVAKGKLAMLGIGMTNLLKGPLGVILGVLALLVTAFTVLYQTNDAFAAQMDAIFGQIMGWVASVMPAIMGFLTPLIEGFMVLAQQVLPILGQVFGEIFTQLGPTFQTAFGEIMGTLQQVLPPLLAAFMMLAQALGGALTQILPILADAFMQIMDALLPLIPVLIDALVPAFTGILNAILPLVPMLIDALIPAFVMIVEAIVPLVTQLLTTLIPAFAGLLTNILPLITMIINQLVPAFVTIIEAIMPIVTMIIELLVPIIITLMEAFMPLITMIIEMLVPVLLTIIEAIMPIVTTILDLLMPVLTVLIEIFAGIVEVIMVVVGAIIDFLMPIIVAIIQSFTDFIKFLPSIGKVFEDIWNGIVNFFKGISNWLIGIVEGMVNGMIDAINNFTRPFRDAIEGVVEFFGGNIEIGIIPNVRLPRLAKGGVVSPVDGGTMAVVAEAGRPERIEPLDANGMSKRDKAIFDMIEARQATAPAGGISITVNPSPGMNERELASLVSRELAFQMRKGSVY